MQFRKPPFPSLEVCDYIRVRPSTTTGTNYLIELNYEDVLTYARKIAKYTRPPGSQLAAAAPEPTAINGNNGEITNRPGIGLTQDEKAILDPSARVQWAPWPSEEVMRRGALAQIAFEGPSAILPNNVKPITVQQQQQQQLNGANGESADPKMDDTTPQADGYAGEKGAAVSRPREVREHHPRPAVQSAIFDELDLFNPDEE